MNLINYAEAAFFIAVLALLGWLCLARTVTIIRWSGRYNPWLHKADIQALVSRLPEVHGNRYMVLRADRHFGLVQKAAVSP
jgi:hypothetical protein